MGITFSCPFADIDDFDTQFESILVRSISFGREEVKSALRSVSFNGRESKPAQIKSFGSGKMILEGLLSPKGRDLEDMGCVNYEEDSHEEDKDVDKSARPTLGEILAKPQLVDSMSKKNIQIPLSESGDREHQAAVKLQKTYKSFRTRRQLADCAVLVEQRWWKLLDFAVLRGSSISFFDVERNETAVSRWSRARTKAAKVGKGLSKDEKARKLALQHWLEAIDPRHRYGHNLQFYYAKWLHCESRQPFFYWLDIGEGKEVTLERCHRSKLQQQCIKYLGPIERKAYEVVVDDGKFCFCQSGKLLDTREGPEGAKWIFVLSVSKILYVGMKIKGTFQHSSFLAGGATLSAGRLVVEDGYLKAVWPHSGHYLPTVENFEVFMSFLVEENVDLSTVQKSPKGEDEVAFIQKSKSIGVRNSISVPDFARVVEETEARSLDEEENAPRRQYFMDAEENLNPPSSRWSHNLRDKIKKIQILERKDVAQIFKNVEEQGAGYNVADPSDYSSSDGYETAEEYLSDVEFMVSKDNLFGESEEEEYQEPIPQEKIIKRINSHKGLKSYQLAQQLSCRWTTGAGPRIGCVRDYPSELQFRALEEVNLSPRSVYFHDRSIFGSSNLPTPTGLSRTSTSKSHLVSEQEKPQKLF